MPKFKINTKEKFAILTPEMPIFDANMAADVNNWLKNDFANTPLSLIFDLSDIRSADQDGLKTIIESRQLLGQLKRSFALAVSPDLMIAFKQKGLHHQMNITPTLQEAIDIVMMEELERELNAEPE